MGCLLAIGQSEVPVSWNIPICAGKSGLEICVTTENKGYPKWLNSRIEWTTVNFRCIKQLKQGVIGDGPQ